jgi:hypothetical protein
VRLQTLESLLDNNTVITVAPAAPSSCNALACAKDESGIDAATQSGRSLERREVEGKAA